jgi:hypothetical protein
VTFSFQPFFSLAVFVFHWLLPVFLSHQSAPQRGNNDITTIMRAGHDILPHNNDIVILPTKLLMPTLLLLWP